MMETDPKLLEILVCPLTKTTLHYDRDKQELVCRGRGPGLSHPRRRAGDAGRTRRGRSAKQNAMP